MTFEEFREMLPRRRRGDLKLAKDANIAPTNWTRGTELNSRQTRSERWLNGRRKVGLVKHKFS